MGSVWTSATFLSSQGRNEAEWKERREGGREEGLFKAYTAVETVLGLHPWPQPHSVGFPTLHQLKSLGSVFWPPPRPQPSSSHHSMQLSTASFYLLFPSFRTCWLPSTNQSLQNALSHDPSPKDIIAFLSSQIGPLLSPCPRTLRPGGSIRSPTCLWMSSVPFPTCQKTISWSSQHSLPFPVTMACHFPWPSQSLTRTSSDHLLSIHSLPPFLMVSATRGDSSETHTSHFWITSTSTASTSAPFPHNHSMSTPDPPRAASPLTSSPPSCGSWRRVNWHCLVWPRALDEMVWPQILDTDVQSLNTVKWQGTDSQGRSDRELQHFKLINVRKNHSPREDPFSYSFAAPWEAPTIPTACLNMTPLDDQKKINK